MKVATRPARAAGSVILSVSLIGTLTAAAPPRGYSVARERIVTQGRALSRLVRSGDAAAIHRRLAPEAAAQVSEQLIAGVLRDLRAGSMRERVGESALPLDSNRRFYAADHRTTDGGTLTLTALLDARDRLTFVTLAPRALLPRDPAAGYRMRSPMRLPFNGRWWVIQGGGTAIVNHHVVAPDQRHALDLVVWRDGATHRGLGLSNSDYWAWGWRVRSPADAVVVEVKDGVADNQPQVEVSNPSDPAGNHVVLRLADGEYALLAHLQRGTVKAQAGQHVRPGDVLGLAGNSGNSSEPHLHFHVQDRAELFGSARGLPIRFVDYTADGKTVRSGAPVQGQFVSQPR